MAVSYNYLNLPELFSFNTGGAIGITYTSEGQKLQKAVTGSEASLKDYCETIEYEDENLTSIYHSEGRVVRNGNLWEFEWFLRDHLGSNRVVFKEGVDGLEVIQQTHNYVFGAPMEGTWDATQPTVGQDYLYNGKERTEDYDLGWQDFGFRWALDGWLPIFSGVDPISEEFAHVSTYNYAENSPVANIDLHGLQALHYGATSSYTGEGQKFVQKNPKTAAAIAVGFVAALALGGWAMANPASAVGLIRQGGIMAFEGLTEQQVAGTALGVKAMSEFSDVAIDAGKWSSLKGGAKYSAGETVTTKSGYSVTIKNSGYPDFSDYAEKEVQISMQGGNIDYAAANLKAFPELFKKHNIDPDSEKAKWVHKWADEGKYDEFEWHHVEDLETMQLVPNYINNPSKGGLPHIGGTSLLKNQ